MLIKQNPDLRQNVFQKSARQTTNGDQQQVFRDNSTHVLSVKPQTRPNFWGKGCGQPKGTTGRGQRDRPKDVAAVVYKNN